MAFLKRHWSLLFLLLIPLIPLWRAVFTGDAIGPFDQIRQFAPWNGPKPKDAWDVLQADGVLQFHVWRDLVFESWRNFQVPFWNHYQLGGTPLLANSQSAALYPPHILMGVLQIPTALAITLLAWFHLFMAGLGTSKLVRALGGSELGGVIAGASFALSPFMLSWTSLSSVITTVCWIPWLLVGLISIRDAAIRARALDSGRERFHGLIRAVALTSIAVGLLILGGHLQFVAYGFMAAFVFLAWLPFSTRESLTEEGPEASRNVKSPVALCLGASLVPFVVGLLISLPHLLPVLKHSETSHRRNVPSETGYESYIGSAIKPFELANLVTSKALGDPRSAVQVTEKHSFAEYWPPLVKQGANFAESAVTIGPLVLGLLFLAPWRDRRTWPLAIIGVLALLLAMGTILNKALYFGFPGWSSTGSPGRVIVLFILVACVLAGLGVREIDKRKGLIAIVGVVVITFLTAVVLPGTKPAWQQGVAEIGDLVLGIANSGVTASMFIALALGLGIFCLLPKSEKPGSIDNKQLLPLMPLLIVVTGYMALIPTGKPLEKIPGPADPYARIAVINTDWGIVAATTNVLLPPNTAALNRIHEAGGYDSLMSRKAKERTSSASNGDSAPPANGNIAFIKPTADWESLQDLGVGEIWSKQPLTSFPFPHTMRGDVYVYQAYPESTGSASRVWRKGQDPSSAPTGAKVVAEDFQSVTVEVSQAGQYLLSDNLESGWSVTVDGEKAELQTDNWVEVPEGKKTVKYSYAAPGYSGGLMLGIVGVLIVFAGLGLTARKAPPHLADAVK